MTAQLILLNGLGVAVASDSAVTLAGGRRTYDTADKIIPVPHPHRIAALHSGDTLLNGIPYQVLLNEWATSLGEQTLASVAGYRQSFVDWIRSNQQWFPATRQVKDCLAQLNGTFDQLHQLMLGPVNSSRLGEPELVVLTELHKAIDELRDLPSFEGTDDAWLDRVMTSLDGRLVAGIDYWFQDLARSPAIDECLREYTRLFIQKGLWESRTTIAFTGFGSDEMLPGYATVVTAGVLEGILLHVMHEPFVGSPEQQPFFGICPLGQTSAINLFLQGIAPWNVNVAVDAATHSLRSLGEELRQLLPENLAGTDAVDEALGKAELRMAESIESALRDFSDENFVSPLRWTISGLPPRHSPRLQSPSSNCRRYARRRPPSRARSAVRSTLQRSHARAGSPGSRTSDLF